MMKVFISYSGSRSQRVAEALHTWLSDVIHTLEPWVSSRDIDRGTRWDLDIARQLEESRVGILCITQENLEAPWVLFEAGALAKALDKTFVCPYLLDVRPTDLKGPLVQFQSTMANEEDTLKLVRTINKALGDQARSTEQLDKAFQKWWPELQRALESVPGPSLPLKPLRSDRDLLEEVLDLTRSQVVERERLGIIANIGLPSSMKSLADLAQDKVVKAFAERTNLAGGPDDPNATQWVINTEKRGQDLLDGQWHSRWNGGSSGEIWETGNAIIHTVGKQAYIFFTSSLSAYLIVAQRTGQRRLAGRYINLLRPSHTTPWVGLIVSPERIDGQWAEGRWDFRR
jgi:hypothetical protein